MGGFGRARDGAHAHGAGDDENGKGVDYPESSGRASAIDRQKA